MSAQDATTAIASAIAFFVPLLVRLITKKDASSGVKAAAAILGAVVAAVVALFITPDAGAVTLSVVMNTVIAALVAQLAAHKVVWSNVVGPALSDATSNFGAGTNIVPSSALIMHDENVVPFDAPDDWQPLNYQEPKPALAREFIADPHGGEGADVPEDRP